MLSDSVRGDRHVASQLDFNIDVLVFSMNVRLYFLIRLPHIIARKCHRILNRRIEFGSIIRYHGMLEAMLKLEIVRAREQVITIDSYNKIQNLIY